MTKRHDFSGNESFFWYDAALTLGLLALAVLLALALNRLTGVDIEAILILIALLFSSIALISR